MSERHRHLGALANRALRVVGLAVYLAAPGPLMAAAAGAPADDKMMIPSPRLDLFQSARLARHRLAGSLDSFLSGFAPSSRVPLGRALSRNRQSAWPQVIAGAFQVRHEDGRRGTTLWFNPIFDAGLLVNWEKSPSGWAVTEARWVLGRDIRGSGTHEVPQFSGTVTPIGFDQAAEVDREIRRMTASDWQAPKPASAAAAEVVSRVEAAQAAIDTFKGAPGHERSLWQARTLLTFNDSTGSALSSGSKKRILSLDDTTRLTLRWVSAYRGRDADWMLVGQSPFAPGQAWLVAFSMPTDTQPARIVNVSQIVFAIPEFRP